MTLPLLLSLALFSVDGELEVRVVDKDSGEPIAVRMHVRDAKGQPIKPPKGVPFWKDHFVFQGKLVLKLRPGNYTFEMERGPEYRIRAGGFSIEPGAADNKTVEMQRFADLKKEGWWSGELHIHRDPAELPLHLLAEDLHVAPVITWWNDKSLWDKKPPPARLLATVDEDRFYHLMAGEDERGGGALLYFQLPKPLPIAGSAREHPSPVTFLKQARETKGVHVDIEKPFWWDVPTWIATGMCDTIGLANNHMQRDGMYPGEAWGKPRDTSLFPGPLGNGRWTQEIYYHVLNCGLRVPPSAGSASGVLANPVGYNRVYVFCGDELDYDRWWEGLRAGQSVVTNGPLIRNPRANGELPGFVFRAATGSTVTLNVQLNLSLREQVEYLEIVKDGEVVEQVRLDQLAQNQGALPAVQFRESGWLLVRAVTTNAKTYRFATTAPYYVEIGGKKRISRKSAKFFLDWVYERGRQIKLADAAQQEDVMRYHREARDFWQKLVDSANAP